MKILLIIFWILACTTPLVAQDDLSRLFSDSTQRAGSLPVIATFKSPHIVNGQSNETIHKKDLLFVVGHRFGDIAGTNGGINNFYGLDNSSDILIAFDYGISDRLTVGIGRAKGAPNGTSTYQKQLFYMNTKYRLFSQTIDNHIPVSITIFGNGVVSGMERSDFIISDADFQKFSDRMSYTAQAIIARKFSDNLSLALLPTYVRRNYVPFMDMNNMLALGIGGRMKINSRMALIADYFAGFRSRKSRDYFLQAKEFRFYNPLGVGLEIETGGHVFSMIFTNSTAILENQFIPSTSTAWNKGEFRWGFNISRTFSLSEKNAGEQDQR